MKDFDIYFIHTLSVSIADFSKLISVIFLCSFCSLLILDEGCNGCKDKGKMKQLFLLLENEDRSTKHPNLENEAPKSQK